jgi:hypothetical protein
MTISEEQLKSFLKCIAETVPDELDCDRCLELLPIYVDIFISGREMPIELQIVAVHLSQCECCREEFDVILACLQNIEA